MNFFKPDLFVRMNEAQGAEVERFYAEWEAACQACRAHYAEIGDRISPKLSEFIRTVCLHDAEWMGLTNSPGHNGARSAVAVINLRQNDDVISMCYDLHEAPCWSGRSLDSPAWTDDEQLICLYDEIDLLDDVTFSHEILLSNGKIVRLVFYQFNFFISRGSSLGSKAVATPQ